MVNLSDSIRAAGAGLQDVEVTIVVIVTPGYGSAFAPRQSSLNIRENPCTIVTVDAASGALCELASQQQVCITIIVVIGPRDIHIRSWRKSRGNGHESVIAVITIKGYKLSPK